jgi:hypothetical protein
MIFSESVILKNKNNSTSAGRKRLEEWVEIPKSFDLQLGLIMIIISLHFSRKKQNVSKR